MEARVFVRGQEIKPPGGWSATHWLELEPHEQEVVLELIEAKRGISEQIKQILQAYDDLARMRYMADERPD